MVERLLNSAAFLFTASGTAVVIAALINTNAKLPWYSWPFFGMALLFLVGMGCAFAFQAISGKQVL